MIIKYFVTFSYMSWSSKRGYICALNSSDDMLAPVAVWSSSSIAFLRLGYFVARKNSTTFLNAAIFV